MGEIFSAPMRAIMTKAVSAIEAIDVTTQVEQARGQIMLVGEIMQLSTKIRDECLDNVYAFMEKQIEHFSSSVEAYNTSMKETFVQALDLYKNRIETEIGVRMQILSQKRMEAESA